MMAQQGEQVYCKIVNHRTAPTTTSNHKEAWMKKLDEMNEL